MSTLSRLNLIFIIVLFLCIKPNAQSSSQKDVYLKIQPEIYNPIILIFPPFETTDADPFIAELQPTIRLNLEYSGFFEIINLNSPNRENIISDIISRNNSIVTELNGVVKISKKQILCDIMVKELPNNRLIFKKDFKADVNYQRELAHKISDEIVFYLVGEKGIANTKIAFSIENGNAKEIGIIDYDGFNFETLTENQTLNLSPTWIPNGEGIIFMSYLGKFPSLYKLELNSRKITALSLPSGMHSAPAISPDGNQLLFAYSQNGNSEIYSSNLKGLLPKRLTNHPAIDSSPCWSPSGRQIAFTSDRSGSPQIYIMDSEGGNVRRLTFEGSYNDSPDWSPRGDLIAFVSREMGGFQIYVIDINGENLRRITDSQGSNENPSWSPDGLQIVYASNRNSGKWNIYITNLTNLFTRQLTFQGGCHSPNWSNRLPYNR